jgi:peptidoglycan hydrolase CwlO-like protein
MTKKTTLKELGDMLAYVVKHMATKDDIANLGEQLTSVERELKSIRRDLDDLREKVENVSGFQKEIDHALERIAAIEKHLGLDKKIAA